MPRTLTRSRSNRRRDDDESYEPVDDVDTTRDDEPRSRRGGGGRSTSRRQEDDEPQPSRGRSRSRSRRDDDDDQPGASVESGWGAVEKIKSSSAGDFEAELKPQEDSTLVKILDSEPFAVYKQHWIERTGKRSFICAEKNCPLCDDTGDRPSPQACFNVVDMSETEPTIKVWRVSKRVADILKRLSDDRKTSPLNREDLYFDVYKTGTKKGGTQINVQPVKARDLEEDWDVEPLTDDEIESFEEEMYGPESVNRQKRSLLQEIADEHNDA